MAGVLNFALGMTNGGFLSGTGQANAGLSRLLSTGAKVGSMLATLTGLGAGAAGVFHQISEGGRLFDLSRRLQTTVFTLASLEHAFEDVGVGAQSVSAIVGQLQKSLGGFNEFGEPTKDVFAAIGLSVEQLKGLDAPRQIDAIGRALAKLGKEDATAIAAKIVSKGSAGDLLQIARSADDFSTALEKAAPRAAILARNAAAFDRIGDTLGEIRLKASGLFAGIAEGVAPGIQSLLDKLNGIDLTDFGVKVGQAIGVGVQAIKDGEFGELLTLGLNAGIERSFNFMSSLFGNVRFWQGLGEVALAGFGTLGTGLIKVFTFVNDFSTALFLKSAELIGSTYKGMFQGVLLANLQAGKLIAAGLGKTDLATQLEQLSKGVVAALQPKDFKSIFADQQAKSGKMFNAIFGDNIADAFDFGKQGTFDIGAAIKQALAASGGPASDAFAQKFQEILSRVPKGREVPPGDPTGEVQGGQDKSRKSKSDANALERIGLVTGFGSGTNDYARKTADNTRNTVKAITDLKKVIESATNRDLVNFNNLA